MQNPIGWFEIYVNDIERAITFYQTVFQVKLEKMDDPNGSNVTMYSFGSDMESYGATGALVQKDNVEPCGHSTLVYFACDDCGVEAKRAVIAGGKIEKRKMPVGDHGFIALISDTEGNIIGLHSQQ